MGLKIQDSFERFLADFMESACNEATDALGSEDQYGIRPDILYDPEEGFRFELYVFVNECPVHGRSLYFHEGLDCGEYCVERNDAENVAVGFSLAFEWAPTVSEALKSVEADAGKWRDRALAEGTKRLDELAAEAGQGDVLRRGA